MFLNNLTDGLNRFFIRLAYYRYGCDMNFAVWNVNQTTRIMFLLKMLVLVQVPNIKCFTSVFY